MLVRTNRIDLAKLDRDALVALIFKLTAGGTGTFEVWTSVLPTLARTVSGPTPLDAIVESIHPATPRPA